MGKAKILAKYRLHGKSATLLFIFSLTVILLFLSGDFSFIVSNLFDTAGIFFDTRIVEISVSAALSLLGISLLLFLYAPFRLGCERWFLLNARGEKAGLKDLFYYFTPTGFTKSVSAFLFCLFKKCAAFLLFIFPCVCLSVVLYFSLEEGEISLTISYVLLAFSAFLLLTGMAFYFFYSSRFFAFYDAVIANEKIKPRTAFEKSLEITEGAYAKICLFRLSFLPWLLLSVLVFPAFYVWGYYRESKTMLCLRNDLL